MVLVPRLTLPVSGRPELAVILMLASPRLQSDSPQRVSVKDNLLVKEVAELELLQYHRLPSLCCTLYPMTTHTYIFSYS
uniref:Uncharacterized protein n=1 Tax=Rhinolophus ferrumequinum TaxID=59479 RepID=A0A671F1V2_RHIFE